MHIPDGYLGPQTYVPCFAAMGVAWVVASARVKKTLKTSQVPLMALGAAFCFVIMMFNIPIPGGTTGHAVGAVLIAVLLGPWAAVIAVSLALVVQALLFGDGGITAIGANSLNMAVIMPFTGWFVYRLIAGKADPGSKRHWIGGAVGGYVGLNLGALATAIMFGIQPLIAHDAAGKALYCPFGLNVAVPAMMGGHLILIGFVEAIATGLVVKYLQKVDPSLFRAAPTVSQGFSWKKLGIGLGVLAILSPLGLWLPARFAAGSAWGEWSAQEIKQLVGYMPAGMGKLDSVWQAPMTDYGVPGQDQTLSYVLAGVVGVVVIIGLTLCARRLLAKKGEPETAGAPDVP